MKFTKKEKELLEHFYAVYVEDIIEVYTSEGTAVKYETWPGYLHKYISPLASLTDPSRFMHTEYFVAKWRNEGITGEMLKKLTAPLREKIGLHYNENFSSGVGVIDIEGDFEISGTAKAFVFDKGTVRAVGNAIVHCYDKSSATSHFHTHVYANDSSKVTGNGAGIVTGKDASSVYMDGTGRLHLYGNAKGEVRGMTTAVSQDKAKLFCYEDTNVWAAGDSEVLAYDRAYVRVEGNASVKAFDDVYVLSQNSGAHERHGRAIIKNILTGKIEH